MHGWLGVVAATAFTGLALMTSGCGASGRMPPLSNYRPPLRVSPIGLAVEPRSARVAKHALRAIASTMRAPRFFGESPIRFGDVQYRLIIVNAGTPEAFTADQTVAQELTVMPDSSAMVHQEVLTSPRFVSRIDRLHWRATGRRPYASPTDQAGASSRSEIPPGGFTFTPHGRAVTFKRVRALPTAPRALMGELGRLLGATGDSAPPAGLSLRQYGFLLATAPLSRAARKALLAAIGALSGVHMCSDLFRRGLPGGEAFCVNGDPTSAEVLIDRHTGVAVVVCERLDDLTPLYPNFAIGALLDSYTFTLQSPSS